MPTYNPYVSTPALYMCHFTLRTKVLTSRAHRDYGRQFYVCQRYREDGTDVGCRYFKWVNAEGEIETMVLIRKLAGDTK